MTDVAEAATLSSGMGIERLHVTEPDGPGQWYLPEEPVLSLLERLLDPVIGGGVSGMTRDELHAYDILREHGRPR